MDFIFSASAQFLLLSLKAAGFAHLAQITKTRRLFVSIGGAMNASKEMEKFKWRAITSLLSKPRLSIFSESKGAHNPQRSSAQCRKRRKRTGILAISKKNSRKLLPFNPSKDPIRRWEQMASLASALTATRTQFSNDLTYVSGMAPRSTNLAALERDGMQVLSKDDTETLDFCKNMMERGECPPFMVVFYPWEGFPVEADRHVRDLTIITEYVGDVDYLKNREDDGDSMMRLLTADDPFR
ncbi:hypothetical protein OROGR_022948 [Orobanche gracilis]